MSRGLIGCNSMHTSGIGMSGGLSRAVGNIADFMDAKPRTNYVTPMFNDASAGFKVIDPPPITHIEHVPTYLRNKDDYYKTHGTLSGFTG